MFNFIQKLIYSFLSIQEKVLRKKLRRNFSSSYSNATSKKVFGQAASLELNSNTKRNQLKLETDVKLILKKCANNPQKLLAFIRKNGTKVLKVPFAKKVLAIIGYEEGFIAATQGIKALYINVILNALSGEKIKISLKNDPIFILNNSPLDYYFVMQQFHKWYAMKLNLPGFDAETQNNFQKYLYSNDNNIKLLSVEEILGLKEAIARDVESINFILDFAKSTAGSKNALKKIITGGASV